MDDVKYIDDKVPILKLFKFSKDMLKNHPMSAFPSFFDQPERSKREDSWPSDHIWCGCPECGECKCQRCGALNTAETS